MTSDTVQNPCASVALNMQSFADLSGMGPQAGNNKHARRQGRHRREVSKLTQQHITTST